MPLIRKADGFQNEQFFIIQDTFISEFKKAPLPHSLLITLMGYYPKANGHYIKRPHGCGTALLMYCSAGYGYYSINEKSEKKLTPGELIIIPPHTPHEYWASDDLPWNIYWVHFKGSFAKNMYELVSNRIPIKIYQNSILESRIKEIFNQCFSILQFQYHYEEYLYICQLIAEMLSILPCVLKTPFDLLALEASPTVEKTISFMREHLHEEISGQELAKCANLSYSRLSFLFRRATGYPPIEFFLRCKIRLAAKDLYYSNIPIKDIALSYGIEDPYYFSRLFKKIVGLSPLKFRNKGVD